MSLNGRFVNRITTDREAVQTCKEREHTDEIKIQYTTITMHTT